MLVGCGNVSATSEQTAPKSKENITTNEAPAAAAQEIAEEPQNNESSATVTARETTLRTKNVDWQDYVEDGVFNMDNYAEALGYTVIKADKSHSWYIYDTVEYHYCIVASGPTLNVMFDSYNVGYAINIVDDRNNSLNAKICTQSQTVTTSEQWLNESSALLEFIATNNPSEEDFHNYSEIKTLHLLCTKWSECFITDERGVVMDTNGTAEQFWKRNWENDD